MQTKRKAAFINRPGGPDSIVVEELTVPTLAINEVLVKVLYTTVNHVDCYIRSGKYALDLPKPFIIGRDFCGEVIEVGANVTDFKVADKVWSHCQGIEGRQGTFAELLAVEDGTLLHLPKDVAPEDAICVFHSAFTTLLGLEREAQLKAGEVIYVHGAGGNIGAMIIQIAKSIGAYVIAGTHGEDKTDYCYSIGADAVIDYQLNLSDQIKKLSPVGVHVLWNTARHHDFKTLIPLLASKGRYILMAGSGTEALLPIGDLYTRDASIRGFTITNATREEINASAIAINDLLSNKRIQARASITLPLEKSAQAHAMVEKGEQWGKVIIKI